VTYDRSADAAYIYLRHHIADGDIANTHPCDPAGGGAQVFLDFDASGVLLGIELLDASRILPPEMLERADEP
jgi:uncharacterized protein YuzE